MAIYLSKDQNWQEESTVYWFNKNGQIFGIVESGINKPLLVDCDGSPIVDNYTTINDFVVTDRMRND